MEVLGKKQRAASLVNYGVWTGIIPSFSHKECKIDDHNLRCCVRSSMGPPKLSMASPTEHPIIKQMMEASKTTIVTKPKNPKGPLEVKHVKKLIDKFGSGDLSNLQTTCLMVLGFSGFLRWDDLSRLKKQDLEFVRDYMRVFLEKRKKWPIPRGFMDFNCKDIKPYLSGPTNGKVLAERRAQPQGFCFQKGFAHCKWHEPHETTNDLLSSPRIVFQATKRDRARSVTLWPA